MKALICPNEPAQTGYRVAQVEPDANTFPVAEPLFWKECPDDVIADQFWYDPMTETFNLIEPESASNGTATTASGNIPQSVL